MSLVTESYLSDHHVHQRANHLNMSDFRCKFLEFCNSLAEFGAIRHLVNLSNGHWIPPDVMATFAVRGAASPEFDQYFKYREAYRALALHENNEIELIADQNLPVLQWIDEDVPGPGMALPGTTFLREIGQQTKVAVWPSPHFSHKMLNHFF